MWNALQSSAKNFAPQNFIVYKNFLAVRCKEVGNIGNAYRSGFSALNRAQSISTMLLTSFMSLKQCFNALHRAYPISTQWMTRIWRFWTKWCFNALHRAYPISTRTSRSGNWHILLFQCPTSGLSHFYTSGDNLQKWGVRCFNALHRAYPISTSQRILSISR